jgi:REP element-mobilizing transposase RayT
MEQKKPLPERKFIRLKHYDYSRNAIYYVTICTKEKQHLFGKVIDEKMACNTIGNFVEKCWLEIPSHHQNVKLHEYVIMPNHIHGLIEITESEEGRRYSSPTLGNVIKGFKIGVTKWCKVNTDIKQVWQRNYYEHIIRDENELWHGIEYIQNNPENWKKDKYY